MNKIILVSLSSLLLFGCKATHLVYVHEASMGIDVAVSTEGTGRMVFGYDQETYAIVPRKKENEDAISLTSFGCVYAQGVDEISFNHFISSGEAAKKIVQFPEAIEKINEAFYGGGEKCD